MKISNQSSNTTVSPPVAIGSPLDSNSAPPAQTQQLSSASAPSSPPVFTATRQSEFPENMKLWLQQVAVPRLGNLNFLFSEVMPSLILIIYDFLFFSGTR
jgi:hypothetical protein